MVHPTTPASRHFHKNDERCFIHSMNDRTIQNDGHHPRDQTHLVVTPSKLYQDSSLHVCESSTISDHLNGWRIVLNPTPAAILLT